MCCGKYDGDENTPPEDVQEKPPRQRGHHGNPPERDKDADDNL